MPCIRCVVSWRKGVIGTIGIPHCLFCSYCFLWKKGNDRDNRDHTLPILVLLFPLKKGNDGDNRDPTLPVLVPIVPFGKRK